MPGFPCAALNSHHFELNILLAFATDIILLLIMISGLIRLGFHERGAFGLGRLMWKQVGYWYFLSNYGVLRSYDGPHSPGYYLARSCDYRRGPTCGEWLDSCAPPFCLS